MEEVVGSSRKNKPGFLDVKATSFLRTRELISEDLPTFDRPRTANSGRPSRGQSLGLVLLFMNSTSLILASPVNGPSTILDPGNTISSVMSSSSTPGGIYRTVLEDTASVDAAPLPAPADAFREAERLENGGDWE
ncbi:hypothetical protein V2J09_009833 [Rumex salicifolius]